MNIVKKFTRNCYLTRIDRVPVISWTASPGPCVTGYYIFRNGNRIAFIPATGKLRYVDICFTCKPATYSVQAINSFGQMSSPITIT